MKSVWLVCGIVLLPVVANPARADWEWTRWGMNAQEVMAASRGAAKPNPRGDTTRSGRTLHAMVDSSGYAFAATFHFSPEDRLVRVSLRPRDVTRCAELLAHLERDHGATKKETAGGVDMYRWRDDRRNSTIVYLTIGPGDCSIDYSA
ncbi:MAG: hypothetical protein KIT16_08810 [Rhodospirillaceae bacterium]|nr:hypothetical protein [Rhodospirillaceae bacterium]